MTMRDEALDMLVVDDNAVLVNVLSEIFQECGHRVRSASDGFDALAEIRNRVPDVLLSDLSMPGMSGYELLSVVRRRFPAIRVVAMSGAHSGEGIPAGVAADAFYAKGSSSVAKLIQVVHAIWHEDASALRFPVPVWVQEISFDPAGFPVLLASCPECLRPFFKRLGSAQMPRRKETCPYCLVPVALAVVRQPGGMDGTPISRPHPQLPVNHAAFNTRQSGSAPAGRMHRQ